MLNNSFTISNSKNDVNVEIGDVKQRSFLPQVKIKRWNNEANLSIRLIDNDPSIAKIITEKEKVIWEKGDKNARFYHKTIDLQQEIYDQKLEYPKINSKVTFRRNPFPHLVEDGYIWGRDDENERKIRQEIAEEAYGNVLIVGLGLGVINEYLKKNKKVKLVTIIEFNQDVIDIVRENYPERLEGIKIIKQEFYDYASTTKHKYDYIYGDIFTDLRTQYLYQWQRFLDSANRIGKTIDGRIRKVHENFLNRTPSQEEEGLEFDVIISKKPINNRIDFSLQHKQVDFFYQPELTDREIKKGFYRAPSVVGSYAVYHKQKKDDYSKIGGENYRSGKFIHIYRPIITDSIGNKIYGELEITEDKLTVIVPEEFLINAVYPVIVDPTFGYTTAGGTSTGSYGPDRIMGSLFTGASGTGVSISAYINKDTSVAAKAVIFTHSTLVPLTNGVTEEKTGARNNAWETYNFVVAPTLTAVDYLVAWYADGVGKGTLNEFYYDTGVSNQGHDDTDGSLTYPTVPNPLSGYSHNTNKYSIYVTYTSSSSTASVSPVAVTFSTPDVTPVWVYQESASVSPVSLTLSIPTTIATYIYENTALVNPVLYTFSLTEVTATYQGVWNASVEPIVSTFSTPDVTSTYIELYTSSVEPILLTFAIPEVTAIPIYNGFVSPVILTFMTPEVTATYLLEWQFPSDELTSWSNESNSETDWNEQNNQPSSWSEQNNQETEWQDESQVTTTWTPE